MKWILIACLFYCPVYSTQTVNPQTVMTVKGLIAAHDMNVTLIHEHILVDFIGADQTHPDRWDKARVVAKVLPYLRQLKQLGCHTLVECTPAYLGRDPQLLKTLSDSSGLHILTNTGYYGARNNQFLPAHALTETADQLAQRWIKEWGEGIEGTGIKPGFIKMSVDEGALSATHQKLVRAAARTHLKTGMTIASHTGKAPAAFEQLKLLLQEGVSPEAFIWVHAQAEKDSGQHVKAARKGAWISLDGLNEDNLSTYLKMVLHLRNHGLLGKVLLSHDAGWYDPDKPDAPFRGYNLLFEQFIPLLRRHQFSDQEIRQLTILNPAQAFQQSIRKV